MSYGRDSGHLLVFGREQIATDRSTARSSVHLSYLLRAGLRPRLKKRRALVGEL